MNYERLKRIIKNMEKHNIEQILITSTSSIFYLTGKWIEPGERMLALYINTNGTIKLFINELFPIECKDLDVEIYKDGENPIKRLLNVIDDDKALGIEKEWPSHFLISLINEKPAIKFINGSSIIDEVRMIKDAEEIAAMKESSKINDKVIKDLIENVIPKNISEKKACKLLDELYDKYGTDSFSFYPLIAYGSNCAEPHHNSDNSYLKDGDTIIMDIGGRTNFYCSDMTRTVFYKKVSEEHKKIYDIVLEANQRAIASVKPGTRFCDIDKAARDVISNAGYGKYFTHRTGHNIGIDVHEFPDVSEVNTMIVQEGMIFSIEPGIYLPGDMGVRIEDLVLVTSSGCEVLNSYPKGMQIIE